jgi:hypothetical protein
MRAMFLVSGMCLLLCAGCGRGGSSGPAPSPQPQEAAASGLATLKKLVTQENYRAMGFQSAEEVQRAQLGNALQVSIIGLDQLKSYRSDTDTNSLLQPSPETIYPVTVDGHVRSSVTIAKAGDGYKTASFGNAPIVVALSRYRQAPDNFAVRIPALNMYYLASRTDNRLMLTPIIDDMRLKLQTGVAVPAQEILRQLVPIATAYNGLPM